MCVCVSRSVAWMVAGVASNSCSGSGSVILGRFVHSLISRFQVNLTSKARGNYMHHALER